jgi:hypothetical protein
MKSRKKSPSRSSPFTPKSGVNGARRSGGTRQKPGRTPATTARKPIYTLQQERSHGYRALSFPAAVGKTTARVELVTSGEYHAVVVVFDDNTAVGFEFQPCFTVRAFGEDIDAVGGKESKTWRKMLSES